MSVAGRLLGAALSLGALVAAASPSAAATLTYKFYSGGPGYAGPYNAAGTLYDATNASATICPNGAGACGIDVKDDPLYFPNNVTPEVIATSPGDGTFVWDDLDPDFGGLGVGVGDNPLSDSDQIATPDILTLDFGYSVILKNVATLFASAHTGFGPDFATVDSVASAAATIQFLLSVDGGAFNPISFLAANTLAPGLSIDRPDLQLHAADRQPEFLCLRHSR